MTDIPNNDGNTNTDQNDFLEQFFRDNDLFTNTDSPQENTKSYPKNITQGEYRQQKQSIPDFPHPTSPTPQKKTSLSPSQKDINLKKLFQNIEEEKKEHTERIQQKIRTPDPKTAEYVPTVEMIRLQSEFRLLFEDFLKILPLIEKSARLQEIEERYSRESRSGREYFPELWENEGSIIFKEIHNIPHQKTEKTRAEEKSYQQEINTKKQEQKKREQEKQIAERKLREEHKEELQEKQFLEEQQKREEAIRALQKQEAYEAEKKEIEKIKILQQKEKYLQEEKQQAEEKRRAEKKQYEERQKKIQELKDSFSNFSSQASAAVEQKTKDVFAAATKKFSAQKNDISETISTLSSQKDEFIQKHSSAQKEKIKKLAHLRALKREQRIHEQKTESGILETIKIVSMVAGLFIISMIGLNSGALLEVTEKYWNAEEYAEKQESTHQLVEQSEDSVKNTFSHIPTLPVAGPKTETEKGFDIKMYLNISPPDTRIVIPTLGKNIPILSVENDAREQEDWDRLEKDIQSALRDGVVHYPGTANPGQHGNVFITGHSSYYPWDDGKYKDVFAALHDLEEGDEYFIFHKGKKYKYVITTRKVVDPSDVSVLEQDTSKKTSTLMTCTPIGTTAKRLILKASEVGVSY